MAARERSPAKVVLKWSESEPRLGVKNGVPPEDGRSLQAVP